MEENFYFEHGLDLHRAFAGAEVRNLRLVQERFGVGIAARDGGVTLSGNPESVTAAPPKDALILIFRLPLLFC